MKSSRQLSTKLQFQMTFQQTDLIQSVLVGRLSMEVILRTEISSTRYTQYTLMHQKI